jgi:hypothetical protein
VKTTRPVERTACNETTKMIKTLLQLLPGVFGSLSTAGARIKCDYGRSLTEK